MLDVDFLYETVVDCRQKGPKCCDLQLVRTPLIQCKDSTLLHLLLSNIKYLVVAPLNTL